MVTCKTPFEDNQLFERLCQVASFIIYLYHNIKVLILGNISMNTVTRQSISVLQVPANKPVPSPRTNASRRNIPIS
jgi:hypothetical protein